MKLKLRHGKEYIESHVFSKRFGSHLIINLKDKGTYQGFFQKRNHLVIKLFAGFVDLVFTGEVPKIEFKNYCKDQVVFNVL